MVCSDNQEHMIMFIIIIILYFLYYLINANNAKMPGFHKVM